LTPRSKPDPRPMRVLLGFTGLAAATAMVTAVALPPATAQTATTITAADAGVTPVRHVIRYVQLQPGQTAPPNASVKVAPQPTPRVVVVTTKQSGKK
jgi:hypothetical protein